MLDLPKTLRHPSILWGVLRRSKVSVLMSVEGQTEKNSVRAYVFCFALELGHCSMPVGMSQRCTDADLGMVPPR
jgi:hypothetical protein